jgi:hypothetical protein
MLRAVGWFLAGGYAAAAPFLLWSEIASDNPGGAAFVAFVFAAAVSLAVVPVADAEAEGSMKWLSEWWGSMNT